ncbi:MAG: thiamine phosphate synthase [Porcipelethomonas sp.]
MIRREQLLLYAVTDRKWTGKLSLYEQIEQALKGGVTCVQLREKNMAEDVLIRNAVEIRRLCHRYGVPLIINDNVQTALKSGADGVHVGQEDCPVSEVRKMTGENFIIGVTAKTVHQAQKAEADGADYLGVGAVFPSPTKKNAIRITKKELSEICKSVAIPAVAIGGITAENICWLKDCGICGTALVSAVFGADDIYSAVRKLKKTAYDISVLSAEKEVQL